MIFLTLNVTVCLAKSDRMELNCFMKVAEQVKEKREESCLSK